MGVSLKDRVGRSIVLGPLSGLKSCLWSVAFRKEKGKGFPGLRAAPGFFSASGVPGRGV